MSVPNFELKLKRLEIDFESVLRIGVAHKKIEKIWLSSVILWL